MKPKLIVLKLGGSVVTRKDQPLTPNLKAIRRLANEIYAAEVPSLLIIHGGGSYGHPVAKTYGIAEGLKDERSLVGFSKTHEVMVSLNQLIIEHLVMNGIPAFGIAPSSFTVTKKGRIHMLDMRPLRRLLETGLVPVLYGDAVLDVDRGCAILSGDQLAAFLAVKLGASKIIMGVDVNGVYSSDPKKESAARLIRNLRIRDLEAMAGYLAGTTVQDVTGGMLGKVSELKSAVLKGIVTMIVNALEPDVVLKVLREEKVVGTRIEP